MFELTNRNIYSCHNNCGAHIGNVEFNKKTIKLETPKDVNFYDVWRASLNLAKTYNKTIRVFYGDVRLNITNPELHKASDTIKCAVKAANQTKTTICIEINDIWLNVYPQSKFANVKKSYIVSLNKQHGKTKGA